MTNLIYYLFVLSGVIITAALLYPREAALSNLLLSPPLQFFYFWFALGLIFTLGRASTFWARLVCSLLLGAPLIIILQRL